MTHISIVECPRDAWQGFQDFIPTQEKINHIKTLANCGFHTIDAGSFVSPRAMPQMVDARPLFAALEEVRATSDTKLLSIIASEGGARRATEFDFIDAWGYPFSVSEEFQLRNSRKNIKDGMEDWGGEIYEHISDTNYGVLLHDMIRQIDSINWHFGDENCNNGQERVRMRYQLCKKTTGAKVEEVPCQQ